MWWDHSFLSGHHRTFSCHSCQYSLGSHQFCCLTRRPASDAASAAWCCTYSSVRVISAQFSSNQSFCPLEVGPMAVLYTVSRSAPHAASTSWSSSMMDSRRSSKVAAKDCLMAPIFILLTFSRFGAFMPCGRLWLDA